MSRLDFNAIASHSNSNSPSGDEDDAKGLKAMPKAVKKAKAYQVTSPPPPEEKPTTVTAKTKRFSLANFKLLSFSRKSLFQRLFPASFSDSLDSTTTDLSQVVVLNVYRINDVLGCYHTGIVVNGDEFTFCQHQGILKHDPRKVAFATFLGGVRLGRVVVTERQLTVLWEEMRLNGFSTDDYHVMKRSCNSFTEEVAKRLDLMARYPTAVLHQSKVGEILSPLASALDLVPHEKSTSRLLPASAVLTSKRPSL